MSDKIKRILYLGLDPSRFQATGEVTHWPIIEIAPRPFSDPQVQSALRNFHGYTHILVTSKSTISILQEYLSMAHVSIVAWQKKNTLAVGQATAAKLRAIDISPSHVAQNETAEGLIAEIQKLDLKNAHFFWPHSSQARSVIHAFFSSRQIPLTSCVLYDPKPVIPKALPLLETYDEIVFTSPSTIDAFLLLFKHFPNHATLKTIGPVTARHLEHCLKSHYELSFVKQLSFQD